MSMPLEEWNKAALIIEVNHLRTRNSELLETMVKLARETPYHEEYESWQVQRAALLAEVGTLRAAGVERMRDLVRVEGVLSGLDKAHVALTNAADQMEEAIANGSINAAREARLNYLHVRAIVVGYKEPKTP